MSLLEAFEALAASGERALADRAMGKRPDALLRDEPIETTEAPVPLRKRSAGA